MWLLNNKHFYDSTWKTHIILWHNRSSDFSNFSSALSVDLISNCLNSVSLGFWGFFCCSLYFLLHACSWGINIQSTGPQEAERWRPAWPFNLCITCPFDSISILRKTSRNRAEGFTYLFIPSFISSTLLVVQCKYRYTKWYSDLHLSKNCQSKVIFFCIFVYQNSYKW